MWCKVKDHIRASGARLRTILGDVRLRTILGDVVQVHLSSSILSQSRIKGEYST